MGLSEQTEPTSACGVLQSRVCLLSRPGAPSSCASTPGFFPPVAGFSPPQACLLPASWTPILLCCFRELHLPPPFLLSWVLLWMRTQPTLLSDAFLPTPPPRSLQDPAAPKGLLGPDPNPAST